VLPPGRLSSHKPLLCYQPKRLLFQRFHQHFPQIHPKKAGKIPKKDPKGGEQHHEQ
jgi:hypothetical protein